MNTYDDNNIFAKILRGEIPNHTVFEDEKTLAFMDVMPQAKGHVLVVPKVEARELSDLPAPYITAVFETAKKVIAAQRKILKVNGIIQLQLNHEAAGQSVFHYHIHLIPGHMSALKPHESGTFEPGENLTELAAQLRAAVAEL